MKTPIRQLWRWLGLAFMVAIVAVLVIVIRQQTEETPQTPQVVQSGEAQTPIAPVVELPTPIASVVELPTPFWTPRPPPIEQWTELPPNYNNPRVSEFMNEAVQITTDPAFRRDVSVDGNYIMWTEVAEPQGKHLFVYDLAKRETRQITEEQPYKISEAVLSGKFIAGIEMEYDDDDGNWDQDIFIYDLVQEEKTVLSLEEINSPKMIDISGHVIVWRDVYSDAYSIDDRRPELVINTYDFMKKEVIQHTLEREGASVLYPVTNGKWVVYWYWPEGWKPGGAIGTFPDASPTVRAWNIHSGEVRDLGQSVTSLANLKREKLHTISKNKVMWLDYPTLQTRIYNLSSGKNQLVEFEPSIGTMKLYGDKYLHAYRNLFNINNGEHIPFFSPDSRNSFPPSLDSDGHTFVWIAHPNEQEDKSHVYVSTPRRLP